MIWKQLLDETTTLQWRHNERDAVPNHQPHDCILKRLFRRRSKKTSKFRVTGLCAGNSPVTGEFPAQRASDAETVTIWWRHHEKLSLCRESCDGNQWPRTSSNKLTKFLSGGSIATHLYYHNIWYFIYTSIFEYLSQNCFTKWSQKWYTIHKWILFQVTEGHHNCLMNYCSPGLNVWVIWSRDIEADSIFNDLLSYRFHFCFCIGCLLLHHLNFCYHYIDVIMTTSSHQPHDCLLNRLFRRRSK